MKQEREIQAQLWPTGITWRERTWAVQMFSPLTRFLHHIRKKKSRNDFVRLQKFIS